MPYPTGRLVYAALALCVLSVAAIAQPWLVPFAWAALWLALAVSMIDLRQIRAQQPPRVGRELPRRARIGEPYLIRYRLVAARRSELTLLDELSPHAGGEATLGPMWLEQGEHVLERRVVPSRRGELPLGPLYVLERSPLGLFARRHDFALDQRLPVHPSDPQATRKGPVSRSVLREHGIRPRRPRGEGTELDSLREYTPDDNPKHIDWRASARVRHPVVRAYRTERNHTLVIAVDCGRLMATHAGSQSKLDHALAAAIGLVRASSQCQDRVGFIAFDRELRGFVSPARAAQVLSPILDATLALEPRPVETSYRVLAETLERRQKKRSLVVLLSDFVEGAGSVELEAYLGPLSRRHSLMLVGLRNPLLRELEQSPTHVTSSRLFRTLSLQDLDVARDLAFARISRLGVHTLDLDPATVTGPVLERYLQLRENGLA